MRQLEMMGRKSSKSEGFSQTASEMSLNSPFTLKNIYFVRMMLCVRFVGKKKKQMTLSSNW